MHRYLAQRRCLRTGLSPHESAFHYAREACEHHTTINGGLSSAFLLAGVDL